MRGLRTQSPLDCAGCQGSQVGDPAPVRLLGGLQAWAGAGPHPQKLQGTELVLAFGVSWEQVLSPQWVAPTPWVCRHPGWWRERRWDAGEKPAGLTSAALVRGLFRGRQGGSQAFPAWEVPLCEPVSPLQTGHQRLYVESQIRLGGWDWRSGLGRALAGGRPPSQWVLGCSLPTVGLWAGLLRGVQV